MRFTPTTLAGVVIVEADLKHDERGFFARTWCRDEFASGGLDVLWVQCNVSFNRKAGTLRGMHWQAAPHEEAKLVRCTAGAAFDVVVDTRPMSPTFLKWVGVELSAENHRAVFIPGGCAHGFQTLMDATALFYQMSAYYHPESARGARWDDPAFGIVWPDCTNRIIAPRDLNFPDFTP